MGAVPVQEIATATADGVTAITKAYTVNVTAGNLLVITCGRFNATQVAFTAADCTLSAGTATIGTMTLDAHSEATPTEAIESGVWSAPVLTSGSATIRVGGSTGAYFELNINEYSGVDVSGTRVGGTPTAGSSNTGTSPATAAGVTSAGDSLFVGAVVTDYGGTNLAPTAGNGFTLIGSSVNGSLHQTGASVRKIVTGASTESLSVTLATTSLNGWCACLTSYKAATASLVVGAPVVATVTRPIQRVIGRSAIAIRSARIQPGSTVFNSGNVVVLPGVGSATFAGLAPTAIATQNVTVVTGVGAATFTGLAPTAIAGNNIVVQPPTGQAVFSGLAPTVQNSSNVTVQPPTGQATFAGLAPTAVSSDNKVATPGVGAAVFAGLAPTAQSGNAVTVAPGTGAATFAGLAPTAVPTQNVVVQPGTGQAFFDSFAPSVSNGTGHKVPVVASGLPIFNIVDVP